MPRKSVRKKTRQGDVADRAARKSGSKRLPKATKAVARGFIKGAKAVNKVRRKLK